MRDRPAGEPRPQAVCILGPTASGKTSAAVELAQHLPVEIISVDSAMIYRCMDIGTAKPTADVLARAPHHLINIRDPWESYSAGQFCRDARTLIDAIIARGNTPLLVGGTFLYFRALQHGLAPMPKGDPALRYELDRRAESEGWSALHADLREVDPDAAARIDPHDRQRIQRALEVYALSGEPISVLQKKVERAVDLKFFSILLEPANRALLHRKIEERFAMMMRAGFLQEVEALRSMPQMSSSSSSMRAVGYRQLWEYLAGKISRAEAERRAVVATRRYAKRQLTWLRSVDVGLRLDSERADVSGPMLEMLAEQGLAVTS